MSTLNALQYTLRNALTLAKSAMKLTEENYRFLTNAVVSLTNQTYVLLGVGEDVGSMSPECTLVGSEIQVAPGAPAPGVVTFAKITYPQMILLQEVILDASPGVTFTVTKSYPVTIPPTPDKVFTSAQMPLGSDNFTLKVTIPQGGFLKRAVMLMELPV